MTATMVLAALAAAAQLTSTPGAEPGIERREVAYEAIATGRAEEAIAVLETRLADEPDDPALLINLGAAYARQGDAARAALALQAALDSRTHYQLELADGRWTDSREAARRALEAVRSSTRLASLYD